MGEAKHTPGPWVAVGHNIYGPVHESSNHKNGRVFVAMVLQGTHRADPQLDGGADRFGFDSEADVRLIKAAPKMLAALEAVTSAGEAENLPEHVYDAVQDAIDEATSEAPA